MLCFKLSLIAIAALIASVAARPNSANEIKDLDSGKGTRRPSFDGSSNALNETFEKPVTEKPLLEQYPHAVLYGGTCGGTILSSKWIITAAHCSINRGWSARFVKAGTSDTDDQDQGVRIRIKRRFIHPLFSVGPYWVNANEFNIKQVAANWDFMLAELENELPLNNKTMMAVQLDDQTATPEGLKVGYAGFGAARHGMFMRSELHGRELEVKADSVCNKALPEYNPASMLCTQGYPPNKDAACNGDSGSGMVADGVLYGIVSWTENDSFECSQGALVVASRVSSVREWIRAITSI